MDEHFSDRFLKVLREKLSKATYAAFAEMYGPGYLLLPMMSPFFSDSTIRLMQQKWTAQPSVNTGFFRAAFIAYPNAAGFRHWPLTGSP